jgi:hypothetical protein
MRSAALELLDEIDAIASGSPVHTSRERGKAFFASRGLPEKLTAYVTAAHGSKIGQAAAAFSMSANTLNRLMGGDTISENMLFRLRSGLEKQLGSRAAINDWRASASVQEIIGGVSDRLIYLKEAIENSNSLKAGQLGVDKIHVAQLVAMLEATLAAIKGPYIERNRASGFFSYLKKFGKKVLEKKAESGLSSAIDGAVEIGGDFLDKLSEAPGISNIETIIT